MVKFAAAAVLIFGLGGSAVLAQQSIHAKSLEALTGAPAETVIPKEPDRYVEAISKSLVPLRRTRTVGGDYGGYINVYDQHWRDIAAAGDNIEILSLCQSACTLVLARVPKERICISPYGYLNFHKARFGIGGPIDIQSTKWMYEQMPLEIRRWINGRGGYENMPEFGFWTVEANELWAMGYRRCGL